MQFFTVNQLFIMVSFWSKITCIFFILNSHVVIAQKIIPLYSDSIPNNKNYPSKEFVQNDDNGPIIYANISVPTIEVYQPKILKENGTGVIIFPGGAYSFLAYRAEGTDIAKKLVEKGITAFVIKYRIPSDSTMYNKDIGPLQDAQQAIKTIRMHAAEYHLGTDKIGIMGFSAGGHLAASLGNRNKAPLIDNRENISLRPDFMILMYPVISMKDSLTHIGSRLNLLGESPSTSNILLNSNEEQVATTTPPTYLTHTEDDIVVSVNNTIVFYQALLRKKIPAEMHIFPSGNHGFILNQPTSEWLDPLLHWMIRGGWL